MPAVKPAHKPKDSANASLVLFAQNIEAIRLWYRRTSHPGEHVGHIVMHELVLNNVFHALDLALRGERWQAPEGSP
jgi:hypothetical protein